MATTPVGYRRIPWELGAPAEVERNETTLPPGVQIAHREAGGVLRAPTAGSTEGVGAR